MRTTDKLESPAVVALDTRLGVSSLAFLDAPAPWRGRRIRLDTGRPVPNDIPARGMTRIGDGDDVDVRVPGLVPFDMIENLEGDFVCTADTARYSPKAAYGEPLPHYATFEIPPYLLMYVPPTPTGLGIPPDYALLTVPKAQPTLEPCLLVKGGYQRALDRKFVLLTDRIAVGGALSVEVPLFRLPVAVAARLVRGVGELNYFVEPVDPGVRVTVAGSHGDRGILTPYASLIVADWELSLLPPKRG